MKKQISLLIFLLVVRCAQEREDKNVIEKTIGAGGGKAEVEKLILEIPPDAIRENVKIKVERISRVEGAVGEAYRLTPEGLLFLEPVRLGIEKPLRQGKYKIATLRNNTWHTVPNCWEQDGMMWVELWHFSIYGIVDAGEGAVCGDGECVWGVEDGTCPYDCPPFAVTDGTVVSYNGITLQTDVPGKKLLRVVSEFVEIIF